MKKKLCALLALALALAVVAGCAPQDKTFTKDGISVTVNGDFKEASKSGHALYLESDYASVSAKKESFDSLDGMTADTELRDYTQSVVDNNELGETQIQTGGAYDYFTYDKKNGDTDYTYTAMTLKGKDAFYLITFQVKKDDYDSRKGDVESWMKSVKVDVTETK